MRKFLISFVLTFIVALICFKSGGQPYQHPSKIDSCERANISSNLDQLLISWHNYKHNDTLGYYLNKYSFPPEFVPTYADSVYIKRLNSINSPIPLVYNVNVKNFIDLYLVLKRKNVGAMIGLSNYYFPIFEEELDKNNMPLELRCLPIIESALNTYAVSRVGATGIWQFMYQTGKLYGLNITSYVDERRDPYAATKAAIAYLKDMYNIYHDWLLVVASYNCGAGNVNRAIRRSGNSTNFWEIYPYLPYETRGYVPAFIAANYVMNYYKEHNIYPTQVYNPGLIDTIYEYRNINFDVISKVINVPIDKIRLYNPQYPRDILPKSSCDVKYAFRLPISDIAAYDSKKTIIYKFQDSIDSELSKRFAYNVPAPANNCNNGQFTMVYYKVKTGDNLGLISNLFNCDIYDLKKWNNIRGFSVALGKWLRVYVPVSDAEQYKTVNNLTYDQKLNILQNKTKANDTNLNNPSKKQDTINKLQKNTEQNALANNNQNAVVNNSNNLSDPANRPVITEKTLFYTIRPGDTLWSISQKFPGNTTADIMRLNNFSSSNIQPGMKIKIKVSN